jgi:hypothetical protein
LKIELPDIAPLVRRPLRRLWLPKIPRIELRQAAAALQDHANAVRIEISTYPAPTVHLPEQHPPRCRLLPATPLAASPA